LFWLLLIEAALVTAEGPDRAAAERATPALDPPFAPERLVTLPDWVPELRLAAPGTAAADVPPARADLQAVTEAATEGAFLVVPFDPEGDQAGFRSLGLALEPPLPEPAGEHGYQGFFDLQQVLDALPSGMGFWNASGMQYRLGSSVRELRCCGDEPELVVAFGLGVVF
jgi:hypothetical protein